MINQSVFDRFWLLHAAAGFATQRLGLTTNQSIALAIAWEVIENDLKDRYPAAFPHPSHDSARNAIGDVLSSLAGYYVAKRTNRKRK
jgi:hypothetical protein